MAYKQKFFLGGKVCSFEVEKIAKERGSEAWVNAVNSSGETPLHIAARYNNLELLKLMLPFFTQIDATDNVGNTVLHVLADHDVEKCVKYRKQRIKLILALISKGADVNKHNNYGWTLAHFAARHCHIELLKVLIKSGADLYLQTLADGTPLLLACKHMSKIKSTAKEAKILSFLLGRETNINVTDDEGYSALHYATERCGSRTVKELLKHGADVHFRTKEHKLTPLHFAALREHNGLPIVKYLLKAGAVVESTELVELTPLQMSVLGGCSDVVKYLIENGANVNYLEKNLQFTPLHIAVYQKRFNLIQLLIDHGADVNSSGDEGRTPLHLSTMLGCPRSTEALISHGAKVDYLYNKNLTPLHVASLMIGTRAVKVGKEKSLIAKLLTCSHNPTTQDYEAIVRVLLANGADVNALTTDGRSSLHLATKSVWQTHNFVRILLEHGANVDLKEPSSGLTALHIATENNFDAKVEVLINAGADVNALTQDGKAPIHLALKPKCTTVLKLLLKNGALVDCKESGSPFTPLHVALEKKYDDAAIVLIDAGADVNHLTPKGESPLHLAFKFTFTGVLKSLIRHGADVNYKQPHSQLTPLNMALSKNYLSAALILIESGADVNIPTQDGRSPLHLALEPALTQLPFFQRDLMKVLRSLIDAGADVNRVQPRLQSTPLDIALIAGHSGAAGILISAGADVNALNENGKRPIHLASMLNDTMVLKALIKHGADVDCREVNLQLTPLHLALFENHKEAATVLICAGADVNALTPTGRSPLHLALESNCKKVLSLLIARGARLNCKRRRCLYSLLYITAQSDDEDMIDQLDDSDKTSLLLAIDTVENRDIKKAIFRLAALVDARNEKSCMHVYPDVDKCCNENSATLLMSDEDSYNFESYNQFVSYRVLSGDFHEFKNVSGSTVRFSNYLPILNYECMLNSVNLSLTGNYETIKKKFDDAVYDCDEDCLYEVEKLKSYSISDSVTLYNVIRMRPRHRRFYTRNLDLCKIKCEFSIYDKLLTAYCYEDQIKAMLMDTVQMAFYKVANVYFPIALLEDIFLDLSIVDVIAVIEAADGID